ncbi:hypothetical protein SCHPADRAFT_805977, partial [Schizopora paradoxa]
EIIPIWNGDPDTIAQWVLEVNSISDRGSSIYLELGAVIPHRLKGRAGSWFWSLPGHYRRKLQQNWFSMRKGICGYWMNPAWYNRQKARANNASYREAGHQHEEPTDYVIRKLQLLQLVFDYEDEELITEIMREAPRSWNKIIDTQRCVDLIDFQNAIKYHEEDL